jgi:hypothetical protein
MKNELFEQIKRLQSFARRTGRSKSESYYVEFFFSANFDTDDQITIAIGGHDIDNWARHQSFHTTGETLLEDFTRIVDMADDATKDYDWCDKCKDHTPRYRGHCLGYVCEVEHFKQLEEKNSEE